MISVNSVSKMQLALSDVIVCHVVSVADPKMNQIFSNLFEAHLSNYISNLQKEKQEMDQCMQRYSKFKFSVLLGRV